MIGLGGDTWVAPVVTGPFCASKALIGVTRPFGAGLGIGTACASGAGTVCAKDGVTAPPIDAAIRSARAVRAAGRRNCSAIRDFLFPVNASSCRAFGAFIALCAKGDIVFP